jgi:hypothetical protein
MSKREFLRGMGFEVPARGRFSKEMLDALQNYEEPEGVDIPMPPSIPIRSDGVRFYIAELYSGQVVRFDVCQTCKAHVPRCHCTEPKPPNWLADEVARWYTSK